MKVDRWSARARGRGFVVFLALFVVSFLFQVNAQERIIPAEDVMDRIETEDAVVYSMPEIKLKSGERLVFKESARVYFDELEMEELSRIDSSGNDLEVMVSDRMDVDKGIFDVAAEFSEDASGEDGANGASGIKGVDALRGGAGSHGTHGSDGSSGADASDITLITPRIDKDLILLARGGNGGFGGNGGNGGNGGEGFSGQDARLLYHFPALDNMMPESLVELGALLGIPEVGAVMLVVQLFNGIEIGDGFDGFDGGHGGDGGDGGHGGDGGDGGKIELIFAVKDPDARIFKNTRGGRGGPGGVGGAGGIGGAGGEGGERGDIWARDGNPGKSGAPGESGRAGLTGQSGKSGSIKAIQTGDEEWLKCYVRYRQIYDLTGNAQEAMTILRLCME